MLRGFAIIFAVFLLTACGGGGGGSNNGGGNTGGGGSGGGSTSPTLTVSQSSASFSDIMIFNRTFSFGVPESWHSVKDNAPQTINVNWSGSAVTDVVAGYAQGVSPATWLDVSFGNSGSTFATLSLQINSNPVPPGDYSTTLTVAAVDANQNILVSRDISVSYRANNAWDVLNTDIQLEFVEGAAQVKTATITQQSDANNGQTVNWTTAPSAHVAVDKTSGQTPDSLTLSVDPSGLPIGTTVENITITDADPNTSRSVTARISMTVIENAMSVSKPAAALSSTPSQSVLSRNIGIADRSDSVINWSATSNQPWLTITGQSTDTMTLTANPASLAVDQMHYADVQVTPQTAPLNNVETVKVGFWVGSGGPIEDDNINGNFQADIATDPIRPFVYAHDGSDVYVYNMFTGALVTNVANVGTNITSLMIDDTGASLFLHDAGSNEIITISLETYTVSGRVSFSRTLTAFARVNGKPLILSDGQSYLDIEDNQVETNTGLRNYEGDDYHFDVSQNGQTLCVIQRNVSPHTIYCAPLSFPENESLTVGNWQEIRNLGSFGNDIVVSGNGELAYIASAAEAIAVTTNPLRRSQGFSVGYHNENIEVDADGFIHIGASGETRFVVVDDQGNEQKRYAFGTVDDILRTAFKVSSDTAMAAGVQEGSGTLYLTRTE